MAMWGRKDQDDNRTTTTESPASPSPKAAAAPAAPRGASMESGKAKVGPSIQIKGELIGNEDLVIEGKVEGVVRLRDHHLTIGNKADIRATVEAKSIKVEGKVTGDVVAGEKVELAAGSTLLGDIVSPRITISDGARFKGSVDMDSGSAKSAAAHSASSASAAKGGQQHPGIKIAKPDPKPAGVS